MRKGSAILIVLTLIATLAVGGAGFFLGKRQVPQKSSLEAPGSSQQNNTVSASPSPSMASEWRSTKLMGAYSFKYPNGWHVSNLWPSDYNGRIGIAIDPEPIDTAPRGGPVSGIYMSDQSGLKNPDEVFQDKLTNQKKEKNLKEDTINSSVGDIYYFQGKVPALGEGFIDFEEYFLIVQDQRIKDNANKHIITASSNNPSYSNILREIILSIKPEN